MRNKINVLDVYVVLAMLSISFLSSNFAIRYILFLFTMFFGLALLLKKKNMIIKLDCFHKKLPILLVFICGISLKLSGFWNTGHIRYILLIYELLIILTISLQYINKGGLNILGSYFTWLIILNLIFMIFMKDISFYNYYGNIVFKGLYYEKNALGYNIMLGIPVFVELFRNTNIKYKKIFYLILVFISFTFIYLSKSTSSLILSLLLIFLSFRKKEKNIKLLNLFPFFGLIFILYLYNYDAIISSNFNLFVTRLLGKGLDFTGRSIIWFFCLEMFVKKPILGYGFNGFWSNTEYVTSIMHYMGYQAVGFHAHNGYIEMLMSTGIIGTFVYFLILKYVISNLKRKEILNSFTNSEIIIFIIIIISNFVSNNLLSLSFSFEYVMLLLYKIASIKNENIK